MAVAIPIAMLAASFISGLFKKKQTQTTTGTNTTAPYFDPAFTGVRDKLLQQTMRGLSGGGGAALASNVTNQRLGAINTAGESAQTGLAARLAAMGIRGGAAAAPTAHLASTQFGQQVGAINQEPLLAHQFDQEGFQNALQTLGFGRGTTSTGNSTTTGLSGGGVGGGFSDLGSMLGFLYGQGLIGQGGQKPQGQTQFAPMM